MGAQGDGEPLDPQAQHQGQPVTRRALLGGAAAGGLGLAAALLQTSRAQGATGGAARVAAQVEETGGLFALEVEGIVGFFTEVSGLGSETETAEYKVKDANGVETIQKAPGRLKWSDITLKRGVTTDTALQEWRTLQEASPEPVTKGGAVILYDETQSEIARWEFKAAWPNKLTVGHYKLLSDDVMILEELTLVPERVQRVR